MTAAHTTPSRRWVQAGVLVMACVAAGGCAQLPFFKPAVDPAAAPAVPLLPVYRVAVALDDAAGTDVAALRSLLDNYLDLARFQNAPAGDDFSPAELDRLIAAAPAQARALLETEGYFNADAKAARVPPADGEPPGALPLVRVTVVPGPRAVVLKLALEASGALLTAAAPDGPALLARLRGNWGLPPGRPFRQPTWSGAKNATLAEARAEGYPAASWQRTAATVDAAANSVALDLLLDSGPLFRLGPLRIEGLQRYPAATVQRLSPFNSGTPYNEQLLLDYQERLQKAGLFEGAAVEIDPDPATADAAPVLVRVRELPLQQATFGAGYSANTGARLTAEHTHRQPFGMEWIAKNKFELGADLKSWTGDLTSYPLDGQYRNLVGGNAERLRSVDELRTSWSARLGRTQDTPRIERLYFAEYTHVRLETTGLPQNSDAASLNYHWVWRDVDSVLLPTRGLTVSAQAALGYALSSTASNGAFARAYGRVTWYQPLGNDWYTTFRGEAGQVFANSRVGVPDTLLFRAGGDDSVRGYAYRSLGPVQDGVLGSGRVLLSGSAEIARPISPRLPAFWWAVFVDAGNAAEQWADVSPAVGVGVGLRWRSPVGPLRVDLAYGERVKAFRAHLSVGIAY